VLFADVRGYTRVTAGLSPEEVPELMNRFYETASSALLSQEGLLGQVEGDNVMGLFVPGLAGPEYRRRAVEGACELVRAVGTTSEFGFSIGVGVATGEEFVGNVGGGGYKDFTAMGEVTNLAARLTATAEEGEVLVDAATFAAVADLYPSAERRDLELKGMEGPVESYAILPSASTSA
jgi:adenylate cyclase